LQALSVTTGSQWTTDRVRVNCFGDSYSATPVGLTTHIIISVPKSIFCKNDIGVFCTFLCATLDVPYSVMMQVSSTDD